MHWLAHIFKNGMPDRIPPNLALKNLLWPQFSHVPLRLGTKLCATKNETKIDDWFTVLLPDGIGRTMDGQMSVIIF